MPRTRMAFTSKAFADKRWSIRELCVLSFAGGAFVASGLALLFVVLG